MYYIVRVADIWLLTTDPSMSRTAVGPFFSEAEAMSFFRFWYKG